MKLKVLDFVMLSSVARFSSSSFETTSRNRSSAAQYNIPEDQDPFSIWPAIPTGNQLKCSQVSSTYDNCLN